MIDIDDGADVDFARGTHDFLQWFQALPGATFHKDIKIVDMRHQDAGRGIIAAADIEPDTVLFTIPRASIICAATSELAAKIPHIFNAAPNNGAGSAHMDDSDEDEARPGPHDPWTLLILVLVYEHLQGRASRWKPYLDIVPFEFDTPMFWQPAELAGLQASAVVAKVGKGEADRMIREKILPVVRAHEHIFFPANGVNLADEQLVHLAHRMGSAIMAYAFDLEKEDYEDDQEGEDGDGWIEDRDGKTMMGMVPMADMLNADAEFNAHINHGGDSLTATSLRPIRAGEEILNYYGPLSSGELLRRYGYVTPKHTRYDVVELPWPLVENRLKERLLARQQQPNWEEKMAEQLTEAGEDFEDSFVLERASGEPDTTGQLHDDAVFDGLPDELGEQVKAFLKAAKKVTSNSLVVEALADKDTRNEIYLDSVLKALGDREGQYVTRLEDDARLISAADRPRGREQMAIWVRRGEKQLLREAQVWVAAKLDELRNKASGRRPGANEDAPSAKRRRA
ncbi:hypothetical protein B0T24DRAFT_249918 [Lasiosphaeria ovina]|uniref:SET domain-containing protein n=1 Tax=Lasiosphaeria ovina TaxID=92902 RepID=A0AAE0N7H4_9PEZI|nr:hypothetical protein B0T24DRAFT_249918 [Lasiosphaeria ovina]